MACCPGKNTRNTEADNAPYLLATVVLLHTPEWALVDLANVWPGDKAMVDLASAGEVHFSQ